MAVFEGVYTMNNKERTVCFSGHRVLYDPKAEVEKSIESAVRKCIAGGSEIFMTGGALGVDTIAALTIIRLQKEYPHIRLVLVLPCPPEQQTLKWTQKQKDEYENILKQANEVRIISPNYSDDCMRKRNRYMVDNSGKLIYYLRSAYGGTKYTVKYAEKDSKIQLVAL